MTLCFAKLQLQNVIAVVFFLVTIATAATASLGVETVVNGLQKSSSMVLGAAPAAITMTGNPKRPFGVDNSTFVSADSVVGH